MAADGHGHVYVLYPQYGAVPDCPACTAPSIALLVSNDNGLSWQPSRAAASLSQPGSLIRRSWSIRWTGKRCTRRGCRTTSATLLLPGRSTSGEPGRSRGPSVARKTPTSRCWRFAERMFMSGSTTKKNSLSPPRMMPDRPSARVQVNPNAEPGIVAGGRRHGRSGGQRLFRLDRLCSPRNADAPVSVYVSRSADGGRTWSTAAAGCFERASGL